METLKFQTASRAEFERLAASNPETLRDLERAGRFLYLQRLAFGGKVAGRSFGVDTNGPSRFDVTTRPAARRDP
jgi:DNA adenine methylase